MKLYYSPGACSLADHIALIEANLSFETVQVDLKAKTTADGADYRTINPKGYVPALGLDDGAVLTENIAILSYIADRAGGLAPGGALGCYRLLETLAYISAELHKSFKPFFSPEAKEEEKGKAREVLGKRFALFEDTLASQDQLFPEGFTVADCYLFTMLFWAKNKAEVAVPPRLSAYYERLSGRESVRKALADEGIV